MTEGTAWRCALLLLMLGVGCANLQAPGITAPDADAPRGPWAEVPAVEMPTGDTSIPISLLRDAADALLKLPGAKVCDPLTQRPIAGLSTEYGSTVYVAGDRNSMSWRVSEPVAGDHKACRPFFAVKDDDYLSSQVWVVGYIHNHVCGALPSSFDLRVWPTDAFEPRVAMAEVRLITANPIPLVHNNTAIEVASALVAERPDGTRIFLRYFTTGEIQQWSRGNARWVTLGFCAPRRDSRSTMPQCDRELQLLRE
jgi:hypothetical protein